MKLIPKGMEALEGLQQIALRKHVRHRNPDPDNKAQELAEAIYKCLTLFPQANSLIRVIAPRIAWGYAAQVQALDPDQYGSIAPSSPNSELVKILADCSKDIQATISSLSGSTSLGVVRPDEVTRLRQIMLRKVTSVIEIASHRCSTIQELGIRGKWEKIFTQQFFEDAPRIISLVARKLEEFFPTAQALEMGAEILPSERNQASLLKGLRSLETATLFLIKGLGSLPDDPTPFIHESLSKMFQKADLLDAGEVSNNKLADRALKISKNLAKLVSAIDDQEGSALQVLRTYHDVAQLVSGRIRRLKKMVEQAKQRIATTAEALSTSQVKWITTRLSKHEEKLQVWEGIAKTTTHQLAMSLIGLESSLTSDDESNLWEAIKGMQATAEYLHKVFTALDKGEGQIAELEAYPEFPEHGKKTGQVITESQAFQRYRYLRQLLQLVKIAEELINKAESQHSIEQSHAGEFRESVQGILNQVSSAIDSHEASITALSDPDTDWDKASSEAQDEDMKSRWSVAIESASVLEEILGTPGLSDPRAAGLSEAPPDVSEPLTAAEKRGRIEPEIAELLTWISVQDSYYRGTTPDTTRMLEICKTLEDWISNLREDIPSTWGDLRTGINPERQRQTVGLLNLMEAQSLSTKVVSTIRKALHAKGITKGRGYLLKQKLERHAEAIRQCCAKQVALLEELIRAEHGDPGDLSAFASRLTKGNWSLEQAYVRDIQEILRNPGIAGPEPQDAKAQLEIARAQALAHIAKEVARWGSRHRSAYQKKAVCSVCRQFFVRQMKSPAVGSTADSGDTSKLISDALEAWTNIRVLQALNQGALDELLSLAAKDRPVKADIEEHISARRVRSNLLVDVAGKAEGYWMHLNKCVQTGEDIDPGLREGRNLRHNLGGSESAEDLEAYFGVMVSEQEGEAGGPPPAEGVPPPPPQQLSSDMVIQRLKLAITEKERGYRQKIRKTTSIAELVPEVQIVLDKIREFPDQPDHPAPGVLPPESHWRDKLEIFWGPLKLLAQLMTASLTRLKAAYEAGEIEQREVLRYRDKVIRECSTIDTGIKLHESWLEVLIKQDNKQEIWLSEAEFGKIKASWEAAGQVAADMLGLLSQPPFTTKGRAASPAPPPEKAEQPPFEQAQAGEGEGRQPPAGASPPTIPADLADQIEGELAEVSAKIAREAQNWQECSYSLEALHRASKVLASWASGLPGQPMVPSGQTDSALTAFRHNQVDIQKRFSHLMAIQETAARLIEAETGKSLEHDESDHLSSKIVQIGEIFREGIGQQRVLVRDSIGRMLKAPGRRLEANIELIGQSRRSQVGAAAELEQIYRRLVEIRQAAAGPGDLRGGGPAAPIQAATQIPPALQTLLKKIEREKESRYSIKPSTSKLLTEARQLVSNTESHIRYLSDQPLPDPFPLMPCEAAADRLWGKLSEVACLLREAKERVSEGAAGEQSGDLELQKAIAALEQDQEETGAVRLRIRGWLVDKYQFEARGPVRSKSVECLTMEDDLQHLQAQETTLCRIFEKLVQLESKGRGSQEAKPSGPVRVGSHRSSSPPSSPAGAEEGSGGQLSPAQSELVRQWNAREEQLIRPMVEAQDADTKLDLVEKALADLRVLQDQLRDSTMLEYSAGKSWDETLEQIQVPLSLATWILRDRTVEWVSKKDAGADLACHIAAYQECLQSELIPVWDEAIAVKSAKVGLLESSSPPVPVDSRTRATFLDRLVNFIVLIRAVRARITGPLGLKEFLEVRMDKTNKEFKERVVQIRSGDRLREFYAQAREQQEQILQELDLLHRSYSDIREKIISIERPLRMPLLEFQWIVEQGILAVSRQGESDWSEEITRLLAIKEKIKLRLEQQEGWLKRSAHNPENNIGAQESDLRNYIAALSSEFRPDADYIGAFLDHQEVRSSFEAQLVAADQTGPQSPPLDLASAAQEISRRIVEAHNQELAWAKPGLTRTQILNELTRQHEELRRVVGEMEGKSIHDLQDPSIWMKVAAPIFRATAVFADCMNTVSDKLKARGETGPALGKLLRSSHDLQGSVPLVNKDISGRAAGEEPKQTPEWYGEIPAQCRQVLEYMQAFKTYVERTPEEPDPVGAWWDSQTLPFELPASQASVREQYRYQAESASSELAIFLERREEIQTQGIKEQKEQQSFSKALLGPLALCKVINSLSDPEIIYDIANTPQGDQLRAFLVEYQSLLAAWVRDMAHPPCDPEARVASTHGEQIIRGAEQLQEYLMAFEEALELPPPASVLRKGSTGRSCPARTSGTRPRNSANKRRGAAGI
jgi:hypothetical protein